MIIRAFLLGIGYAERCFPRKRESRVLLSFPRRRESRDDSYAFTWDSRLRGNDSTLPPARETTFGGANDSTFPLK